MQKDTLVFGVECRFEREGEKEGEREREIGKRATIRSNNPVNAYLRAASNFYETHQWFRTRPYLFRHTDTNSGYICLLFYLKALKMNFITWYSILDNSLLLTVHHHHFSSHIDIIQIYKRYMISKKMSSLKRRVPKDSPKIIIIIKKKRKIILIASFNFD